MGGWWHKIGLRMTLRTKLVTMLVLLFLLLTVVTGVLEVFWVNRLVIGNTMDRVRQNIRAAWQVIEGQKRQFELIVSLLSEKPEVQALGLGTGPGVAEILDSYRRRWALDVLELIPVENLDKHGLAAILSLPQGGEHLRSGFAVARLDRSGAAPAFTADESQPQTMLLYAARTINDASGNLRGVLVAGLDLREANLIVDRIQNVLFEDRFYQGRRVGTVTIFLWSDRIATTVLLDSGLRAVGTQVSEEVAIQTLGQGVPWTGRAWVVDDWYLTRYDPIRDAGGRIIGMLYVGELAQVSRDIRRNTLLTTLGVLLAVMAVALWVRLRFTGAVVRQIEDLEEGTRRFTEGDYAARVNVSDAEDEIGDLARSFNKMAQVIEEDRAQLVKQKQEIERINANYMEMLGFVTHELRSTLGSAIFNVASLKEGVYGALAGDQKEGLDLVEESLSYLEEITNNYLQLSRIEKGELIISKTPVELRTEVIEPVLSGLKRLFENRGMRVTVRVPDRLIIPADVNLLRVVYENLVGNAIKYGCEKGEIRLNSEEQGEMVWLNVWNEGKAIEENVLPTLFRKFRRYDVDESTGRKGTGLGLFIVKQIISVHGGEIRVTSGPDTGTRFSFSLPR
jgi:signal transduction histidine kinase